MNKKDAQCFHRIAVDLEEITWSLDTSWRLQEPILQSEEDVWFRLEAETRLELDQLVIQWVWDRFLPELSDKQKYLLRLRFVAAYRFLYQFSLDNHTTVFKFPKMSEEDFLIWMLTSWWHSVGLNEALHHIDSTFSKRNGPKENPTSDI